MNAIGLFHVASIVIHLIYVESVLTTIHDPFWTPSVPIVYYSDGYSIDQCLV